MTDGPVIALIDGEHHPPAVRELLDRIERERGLAGVAFCGGEEKLPGGPLDGHYGRPVADDPADALRALAPQAAVVLDLADEPALLPPARLRLAALALHLGVAYETPGARLEPPRYRQVDFAGAKLAVIGTGKRTGKTAVAGHWAGLLKGQGADPVIVCMGRGGPPEPRLVEAAPGLDELLALAADGGHAASDYLEDAVLAGVRAVGCRRVGGGLAGEPAESNVPEGAALAASLSPDALIFEGSGSCVPPVQVDRTVCLAGAGALDALGAYRLLRADLALVGDAGDREEVAAACPGEVMRVTLRPEPVEDVPPGSRVALFSTGHMRPGGVEPMVGSPNLGRRRLLATDLDRAVAEGCDVWLTELKAAAIDTVAVRAAREGARLIFLRNRPVGIDEDLDRALLGVWGDA